MAAGNVFEEKIRLYVEATGDAELKQLIAKFGDLGDTADFQSNIARKAMGRFAQALDDIAKVEAFQKLKSELVRTEQDLERAKVGAQQLFREFNSGDKSNGAITRLQGEASKAVNQLSASAQQQRLQLQGLRGELAASGIDTRKLGTAQGELKARLTDARSALATSAKSVAQFRQEAAKAAAEIPAGNKRIAESYSGIGGALAGLRSLAAPVLAFLSFQTARAGVKAISDVAAQAENARRSLQNLYGGVEQGNSAFEALRTLSKENGLAFGNVANDAKKLKAFGLDPLNGSYQALVDQNAAVGGSQQDLSGKVLALGQAWAKQKLQGEEILQLVERGVPVWSLLETATGKNVDEIRKLSEQGKLGRDVIKQLYEEIGRANQGAANKGLTGLTGLLSQVSARWEEFLGLVADAGVTDYFKQQIQSLLSSTGNLDLLAKRVADGVISSLEALKRFGQQIALIGKPIVSLALALARNAEAVVLLGKVYLALKLSQFASGFLDLARAQTVAAASTDAMTAAATRGAGAVTGLGGVLGKLPRFLSIGLAVLGVDYALSSIIKLNQALEYRKEALGKVAEFERSQSDLQSEQLRLGQQLQSLYAGFSRTTILSAERLGTLTREQASEYQFALEQARIYFGGVVREARAAGDAQKEATAVKKWKEMGVAVEAVKQQIADLGTQAAADNRVASMASAAVDKFDQLIAKGQSVKDSVKGIFDNINLANADGLKQAGLIIEQLGARGADAGKQIQAELRIALAGVSDEDLPKVKAAAEAAFAAGSAGAEAFGNAVETINLSRLGVDIDEITTGFSKAGRAAVDQFRGAIKEVDALGLTVEQRSAAIAKAFDNAFKQASTKAELQALKQALIEALSAGDIGFAEFQKRVVETDTKLAELASKGAEIGTEIPAGADKAAASLSNVGNAAEEAADKTASVGDAGKKAGEKAQEGAFGFKDMSVSFAAVSDEAARALGALGHLAGSQTTYFNNVNEIMGQFRRQKDELNDFNKGLEDQLALLDPLAEKMQALRQQFNYIDDNTLRSVAERQQRLEQEATRREEELQRTREQAQAAQKPAEAVQIAKRVQEESAAAATVVSGMLDRVKTAATALDSASTRIASTKGEMVIRVVVESKGGTDLTLSADNIRRITEGVVRELRRQQGLSS